MWLFSRTKDSERRFAPVAIATALISAISFSNMALASDEWDDVFDIDPIEHEEILLSPFEPIFVEFQMEQSHLFDLVRERLEDEQVCPSLVECGTEDCVVEPPEFVPGGRLVVDEGMRLAELPVEITTKTLECTEGTSCQGTKQLAWLQAEIEVAGGQLCASLHDVTLGGLPSAEWGMGDVIEDLKEQLPTICQELPLGAVTEMMGDGYEADVTLLRWDADRVGIRQHFTHQDWPASPDLDTGDLHGGHLGADWSVLMSRGLIEQMFGSGLRQAAFTQDRLVHPRKVSAQWTPLYEDGGFAHGEMVVDAKAGPCSIELDPVWLDANFRFDATKPNTLILDAAVDWDAVDSDVATCALGLGFLTGGVTGPIAMPAVMTVAAIVADTHSPDEVAAGNIMANCSSTGENAFSCEQPIELPKLAFSTQPAAPGLEMQLGRVRGIAAGLVLSGDVERVGSYGSQSLSVFVDSLDHGTHGGCNDLSVGYEGRIDVAGEGRICRVMRSPDPLDVYADTQSGASTWMPVSYELGFDGHKASATGFFNDPYDYEVTFLTTAGTRTAVIPAPEPVKVPKDFPSQLSWDAAVYLEQWANCQKESAELLAIPAQAEMEWLINWPDIMAVDIVTRDARRAARPHVASVVSANVTTLARVEPTRGYSDELDYAAVPIRIEGVLRLDDGSRSTVDVPFSATHDIGMRGIPSRDGSRVQLELTQELALLLELEGATLPRGITAASAAVSIEPEAVDMSLALAR